MVTESQDSSAPRKVGLGPLRVRPHLWKAEAGGEEATGTAPERLPRTTLVRGPIVYTQGAFNNEAVPAIGLAYLAGYMRAHGGTPEIVDAIGESLNQVWDYPDYEGYQCQGLTFDEILDRIPADSEVIGLSCNFSGEWPVHRALLTAIGRRFPDATIVAGGEHITALSEYVLRECADLRLCVRGEGEHTFLNVLRALRDNADLATVPGIGFLDDNGGYVETSSVTRIENIDAIPWPWWPEGYLEKFWDAGKSFGVQTLRDMPMLISRGCPFQCTFCSNPAMWTTRYMLRDIDDVVDEIETYLNKYDITAVQLYDLTAIIKRNWILEFGKRLIERGINIKWSLPSGTRSEALDAETLQMLKDTGCNYLVYAPESGSERVLEMIKKKISLKKLTESALIAKSLGIVLRTNLIIGFPDETRFDVFNTIRYGLGLAIRGVDEVSINIFSPYPGSELFEQLLEKGALTIDDTYFLSLTSLNSAFTNMSPITFNQQMGPRELALYRLIFMMMNYGLGYLFYPSRILRTARNLFGDGGAATVFEHRLKDSLARNRKRATEG